MNVTFHILSAIGIAVLISDSDKIENQFSLKQKTITGLSAFFLGVISHGILDYIPHCYPIRTKMDILLGTLIMIVATFLASPKYRFILALVFLGCVFPDLVDTLPRLSNKLLGMKLPVHENYFPWHWKKYSGSIYGNNNLVSDLNHIILFISVGLICLFRKTDLKKMFNFGIIRRTD